TQPRPQVVERGKSARAILVRRKKSGSRQADAAGSPTSYFRLPSETLVQPGPLGELRLDLGDVVLGGGVVPAAGVPQADAAPHVARGVRRPVAGDGAEPGERPLVA